MLRYYGLIRISTLIVTFKTRKLEKCYFTYKKAVKAFGDQVAKKYIQRINVIEETEDLDELCTLPVLRCHPLTGNRQGQYAIKLTGFYRLIFTMEEDSLTVVKIEEVSKHYDD